MDRSSAKQSERTIENDSDNKKSVANAKKKRQQNRKKHDENDKDLINVLQ